MKRVASDMPWIVMIVFLAAPGCRPGAKKEEETLNASKQTGQGEGTADTIARIVEKAPARLSELEKIIGGLDRDPKKDFMHLVRQIGSGGMGTVEIDYAIDIHHQDPREVEDPGLARYAIGFDSGRARCIDLLKKKYGEPKVVEKDGAEVHRFDTAPSTHPKYAPGFYVFPAEGEGFRLEWRNSVPDFAFVPRTGGDEKEIESKVIELLSRDLSRDRFQSILGTLTKDENWGTDVVRTDTWTFEAEPAGSAKPKRFTFNFGPPLDAAAVIEALGLKQPVIVSTDVHMTSRIMADYKTRSFPKAGGYRIMLHVVKEGLESTDLDWPASAVWKAEAYRIESIEGISLELLE